MLLRLDLVETVMQFSLHITCSCIRTFSFPYLVLFVMVLFCLSPSLSLSSSLRMTPKSKSTPSRNPLHSRASFSDPTPFYVRFRDEKAHQDFSENFSKHGIHSKRRMILSYFSNTTLPIFIHNRGWESLCEIPVSCPTMIIQEFYSNMHGFDTSIPQFVTQV